MGLIIFWRVELAVNDKVNYISIALVNLLLSLGLSQFDLVGLCGRVLSLKKDGINEDSGYVWSRVCSDQGCSATRSK